MVAVAIGLMLGPVSWEAQRSYRQSHSVGIASGVLDSAAIPESYRAEVAAFESATKPSVKRYTQTGVLRANGAAFLVLARIERNRNPEVFPGNRWVRRSPALRPEALGPSATEFGCTSGSGQLDDESARAPFGRCEWRHPGSTGVVIPLDQAVSLQTLRQVTDQVLVADSGRYHPFKVAGGNAAALMWALLAIIASLVLHELGHAAAAYLVGAEVLGISIGMGKKLVDRRWRGVRIMVSALPIGGFVQCRPRAAAGYRWRQSAIWAAGPATNLIIGAVAWMAGTSWALVALINVLLAVANLIPYSKYLPEIERRVGTDGYQLLQFASGRKKFDGFDKATAWSVPGQRASLINPHQPALGSDAMTSKISSP
jgi:hypothetical protein